MQIDYQEEKPNIREKYHWDDEVIEFRKASLNWTLMANTDIAMNNYHINQSLINFNQQLEEYNERQSKIIKDLGKTIWKLKEENQEYKKLFDN